MLDSQPPQAVGPTTWNTSFSDSAFHSSYHRLSEIQDFISDLARDHPDLIEVSSIGRTAEQREMTVLKISNTPKSEPNGTSLRHKGAVVIVGAQHAREVWIPRGYPGHAQLLIRSSHSVDCSLHLSLPRTRARRRPLRTLLVGRPPSQIRTGHIIAWLAIKVTYSLQDFYIIPVANPDGYEYTWTTDRFWYCAFFLLATTMTARLTIVR